jgi:tripartite-type tricarboxylate transporter receptor subunit TctC
MKIDRRKLLLSLAALHTFSLKNIFAQDSGYPNRSIRLLVGFAAGGTPDTIARSFAEAMSRELGQSFVVENRAGANGIIAAETLAKSKPDGYTLLLTTSSIVINPSIYKKIPYDIDKEFSPITTVAMGEGYLLVVNPKIGAKSVSELVNFANKNKNITFSSPGVGNTLHLAAQIFCDTAEIKMTHIPYKGASPALNAVMSGEVNAMFIPPTIAVPLAKDGRITVVGFTGQNRWTYMQEVPTISETFKGFDINSGWHGLFAPFGTPQEIINKIHVGALKILAEPKFRDFLLKGGYESSPKSIKDFIKFVQSEKIRYGEIVKSAQIELQ